MTDKQEIILVGSPPAREAVSGLFVGLYLTAEDLDSQDRICKVVSWSPEGPGRDA